MDLSAYRLSDSVTIARPPEDVYAIVADVTRIGEQSPVCQSAAWEDPAAAGQVGAWFGGHNAIGDYTWDTRCKVVAAEPGVEFAFINCGADGDVELVRWGYTFKPVDGGTEVTESWEILPAYLDFAGGGDPTVDVAPRLDGMAGMARDGMAATLANLKAIAEA